MTNNNNNIALLADAITTIGAAGVADYTIYTDGSAQGGVSNGGSAAIVTTGAASNPTRVHTSFCTGCRWTCSYDTEVAALILATEWILRKTPPPHTHGGFSVVRTPTSSGGPDAIDESW